MKGENGEMRGLRYGRHMLAMLLVCGLAATGTAQAQSEDGAGAPKFAFGPEDVAQPEGLPELGKWMIDPDGTVAHWFSATYEGKHIREPINVVLVDHGATSLEDAKARLVAAAAAAGYPSRYGHSSGYRGFIGGDMYDQLPQDGHAFSNRPFEFDNNHGRIFGPAPYEDGYLFIAAFSREQIELFREPPHQYESFDRARDDFTQKLGSASGYRIVGFVDMDNAIINDPQITTGDHDGRAVLMRMED